MAESEKQNRFAKLDEDIYLRQAELSDKEFRIYSIYCFERWHDTGFITLTLKEIAEKYGWNYDSLCRYHAKLREKNWLKDTPNGILLLTGFTDEKSVKNKKTDKKSVNSLTNYQCDTDEKSVEDENLLTNYQSSLPIIAREFKTQELLQEEEEEENASASAIKNQVGCRDSDELNQTDSAGTIAKGVNRFGKTNTKDKTLTRNDLTTDEWLDWLQETPEYKSIRVRFHFERMCEKSKNPTRNRFISWLNEELADMPIEADTINTIKSEVNNELSRTNNATNFVSNAEKRKRRISESEAITKQLLVEGLEATN